ncbi:MAG: hypothetical protein M4579_003485 [Chaenotheca gracillima]|nr:MAG: hypothetical protein M4579_003485 [Chaenotheca gracillima]
MSRRFAEHEYTMSSRDGISDDHVAELLKKDARDTSVKYSALGLEAFLPRRPTTNAPKPNTRFLRNIIRETDNHNAALLAKESEDSRHRHHAFHGMETTGELLKKYGAPVMTRTDTGAEDIDQIWTIWTDRVRMCPGRAARIVLDTTMTVHTKLRERVLQEGIVDTEADRWSVMAATGAGVEAGEDEAIRPGLQSHQSITKAETIGPIDHAEDHLEDRVIALNQPRRERTPTERRPSHSDNSDSDPLESIIGPAPPKAQARVKARGRGAFASSGIDDRFSASYDPTTDVRANSESEDDWDQALEALRDRQRWKQQGADRLRSAGFTEDEVQKWEKGGQKREEDVRWASQGEGREWDRGKVVDEQGHIDLQPEWGRLKVMIIIRLGVVLQLYLNGGIIQSGVAIRVIREREERNARFSLKLDIFPQRQSKIDTTTLVAQFLIQDEYATPSKALANPRLQVLIVSTSLQRRERPALVNAITKLTPFADAAVSLAPSPSFFETSRDNQQCKRLRFATSTTNSELILFNISGRRSLHIQKHTCSSCGYPSAKIRKYNWSEKAKRRKTTGSGRMRYLKTVPRKFKNGFQTGLPKDARGVPAAE